ncbi:MAG: ECF RNA polymerase sigma factor SigW [Elusimicrobia bacterium ADurb.Bin231]|nr:MAG: ECF RNA polymerase sigma factor SigW [Elusimicrobia bacterium ADurb.Bin231]
MKESEKILIENAQKGDTASFEKLIKKHEVKIYNLLLGMLGNVHATEDLFQETFITAWKKIKSFRGDSELSTWLYRIAVNTVLMKKRKKKKITTISIDEPIESHGKEISRDIQDDWSNSPLATLENKELKKKVFNSIQKLPDKYRAVLVLRDVDGFSNDEVKNILKISLPSVKSRLHRARMFMRNNLSSYFRTR